LHVARANTAGIGRRGVNVRIAEGDWFDALPADVRVDVAVANPPYIAEGSPDVDSAVQAWEPHGALFAGTDGLDAVRRIVTSARRHVQSGGWLVMEIGADQGDAVGALLSSSGYICLEVRPDLAGRDRIAVARVP